MVIECLIRREGMTTVEMGKTRYMFQPVHYPGWKKGDFTTSICEINSEEHLEFLLKTKFKDGVISEPIKSKQFRIYDEGIEPAEKEVKTINLSGYSIVKHNEGRIEGYRVENKNIKPKQYAGSDGTWKTTAQGLTPFDTEFGVWQWLKEELQMEALDKANFVEEPSGVETNKEENDKVEAILDEIKNKRGRRPKEVA